MHHQFLDPLDWLNSKPEFNVTALLMLRPAIHYPSGRILLGADELYHQAYDDFIAHLTRSMLGACHVDGRQTFIPNDPFDFEIDGQGHCRCIHADLALPLGKPLAEQARIVLDVWGRNPWSEPGSLIQTIHDDEVIARA